MCVSRAIARAAVAIALALSRLATASVMAQPPSPSAGGSSESPTDVSRVKRALEQPSSGLLESSLKSQPVDQTTFRVNVTERPFNIWEFWGESETAVPPYVRSWYFGEWHHEFLRMVTPEYARRATLYPVGVPLGPAVSALANAVKDALRARAERNAKDEVQQALEEFFKEHPEARRAPPSPPPEEPPGW